MSKQQQHHALPPLPPPPEDCKGRGGYDCSFVEPPCDLIQTKCPICLCVLHDPFMVDCCGYSYCRECIMPSQDSDKKQCPLCNEEFSNVFPDKRLRRVLNGLQVCCVHAKQGCKWQGELARLEEHLNTGPSGNLTTGCRYTQVMCDYCERWMEWNIIQRHQFEECGKQPFSCDYCHEYQSSREDVIQNHWPVCPCRPASCPNECGVYPEKQHLNQHLLEQCPEGVVECEFAGMGCTVAVRRKDMRSHLTKEVAEHLTLQNTFCQDRFLRMSNQLHNCIAQMNILEKENERLRSTLMLRGESDASCGKGRSKGTRCELDTAAGLTKQTCPQNDCQKDDDDPVASSAGGATGSRSVEEVEVLKALVCIPPMQFTIHSVSSLQQQQQQQQQQGKWLSAPFYSHPQGYKMCLKVYPNGHATSQSSEMSLFVCIMKGQYDHLLKWPFEGLVTLQLLDQTPGSDDHLARTVKFHEGLSEEYAGRVLGIDKVLSSGWGILKFVSIDKLVPKYLKNDCLQIRVEQVQIK